MTTDLKDQWLKLQALRGDGGLTVGPRTYPGSGTAARQLILAGWEHQWLLRDEDAAHDLVVPLRSGTETDFISRAMKSTHRELYVCGQLVCLNWSPAILRRFAIDCADHVRPQWDKVRGLSFGQPPVLPAVHYSVLLYQQESLQASRCARWAQRHTGGATKQTLEVLLGAYFAAEAAAAAADFCEDDPGAAANFAMLAVGNDPIEIEAEITWQRFRLLDILLLED